MQIYTMEHYSAVGKNLNHEISCNIEDIEGYRVKQNQTIRGQILDDLMHIWIVERQKQEN